MFKSTLNRGFKMIFANGYGISCQWGGGNYCSRYGEHLEPGFDLYGDMKMTTVQCPDCEVAIWHESRPREDIAVKILEDLGLDIGHDEAVIYSATTDDVAKLIAYISNLPKEEVQQNV